ncbi:MAG TPA: CotH kinase family protein [bacterium]|nr:CotH kinase family protein [bacterium]HPN42996.1 CotH kinase family protein [bacterium]
MNRTTTNPGYKIQIMTGYGLVLATLLLFITNSPAIAAQQEVIILPESADKLVLIPGSSIGNDWRNNLEIEEDGWLLCMGAPGGVGFDLEKKYDQFISLDVSDYMSLSAEFPSTTCYIRIKFELTGEQVDDISLLLLKIRYDDGFVLYLNGERIAAANAPNRLNWDSHATAQHDGAEPVEYNITLFKELLVAGENLLAIQGLNNSSSDPDFLILPQLVSAPSPFSDTTKSNLPLVFIDTEDQEIPQDYRIPAYMGVIDNGRDQWHSLQDSLNNYNGRINIEVRGSSSAGWQKKQYGLETQDENGNNLNTPLLGLPEENDWILNAPYIDKSLLRNVLTYRLARDMGRYASRTRYCELFLNEDYKGIYILMEKIKRDNNRVDIAALDSTDVEGIQVTGGYILKIDKSGDDGFASAYRPANGLNRTIFYQYHYPADDEILPQQKEYIQNFIREFEDCMAGENYNDPDSGYQKYIDMDSFIDFIIINELAKNVDGYRISTFLYKERDKKNQLGLLYAGPVWDFNLGYGLANYYDGEDTDDWMLEELSFGEGIQGDGSHVPFWWSKLFHDPAFSRQFRQRWHTLRADVLAIDRIHQFITACADTLDAAQERNFTIWTGPGEPRSFGDGFWPVPDIFYSFSTYQDEVDYLKAWIEERIIWIDENIDHITAITGPEKQLPLTLQLAQNSPNPFNSETRIEFCLPTATTVCLEIYNVQGQKIKTLVNRREPAGTVTVKWDGLDEYGRPAASGMYFCRLSDGGNSSLAITRKMLLLK